MKKNNVTRKELVISITEKLGVSQRNAAEIVDTVFATMKSTLINGESIKLVQFGSFIVRKKLPRRGRNSKTGESMTITKRQIARPNLNPFERWLNLRCLLYLSCWRTASLAYVFVPLDSKPHLLRCATRSSFFHPEKGTHCQSIRSFFEN